MLYNKNISFFSLLVFSLMGNWLNAQCNSIDFSASTTVGCAPLAVTFTATNIPSGSKIEWDLGGGFVNGTDTAFRFFTASGQKSVSLRVTLNGQSSSCTTIVKNNIVNALPKPDINLYISDTLLCNGPSSVTFIDSTVGVAKRTWIINGTTQSSTSTTLIRTPSVGDFSLGLLVENSSGCASVYRNGEAVKVFSSIDVEICANIVERDTGTIANFRSNILNSSLKPDSFNWTFSNGKPSTSTDNNPRNITYSNPVGTNAVAMEVIFPGGCRYTDSHSDYIKPFLTIDDDSACIRQELEVTTLASDNGRSDFTMSFPGANFIGGDIKDKFQISYVSAGAKDLVYSFQYSSDNNACQTTVRADDIVVIEGPQARAFSNDKNLCTLDSLLIQSNSVVPSTGNNLYTWRIFDADSNMIKPTPIGPTRDLSSFKIKFDTFGVYNLSLKVENTDNGCEDSILLENYIRNKPPTAGINFSDTVLCVDNGVELTDATIPKPTGGNPYKYQWILEHSDSTNISFNGLGKSFSRNLRMPGQYNVRLIVESNSTCKDTLFLRRHVEVQGILAEAFIDSTLGCPGFQTNLSSQINLLYPDTSSPSYTYAWSVNPGNGVTVANAAQASTGITFNNAGCYSMSLQIEDVWECRKIVDVTRTCIGVEANFGWDEDALAEACLNEEFDLVDSSAFAAAEWRWSVDDPSGLSFVDSTTRSAKVIFNKAGSYTIKQWVSSGAPANCTDSITRVIQISAPEASFSVDKPLTQCAPQSITFTNNSKNADTYRWFYGDGGRSENASASHVYVYTENNINGFEAKLVAFKSGSESCADTFEINSKVRIIGPTPLFSADTLFGCDTTEVTFFNLTNPLNASYIFDYGDGSKPDSNRIRKHTYNYNSTTNADSVLYFPSIIANSFGCDAFYSDTIVIYRPPNASFIADTLEGCRPLTVTLTNNGDGLDFYWDIWNDNTVDSANQDTVVWVIDTVGKFGASIYSQIGTCFDEFKVDSVFEVGRAPQAGFSLSARQGCDSLTVSFRNQTTPATAGFVIDYGDGSKPDTNTINSHLYTIPATHPDDSIIYYPRFTATSFGCDNIVEDTVIIYRSPSVSIGIDTSIGCQPFDVVLTATVSNNFGYEWDFYNDGIVDTQNVSTWPITIDTFGYFDVSITANYRGGCATTVIADSIVRVVDLPQPDFAMDVVEGCDSFEVAFTNNSSPAFTSYTFNFGDGGSATDTIPNHTYYFSGLEDSVVYVPTITGTRVLCNAEFADTVVVYKSPTADFIIDTTFGCEPADFTLISTSTNNLKLEWDVFNDTSTIELIDNDTLSFTSDSVGVWPVRLFVEYLGGCTSSKVVDSLFTVYRMPEPQIAFDTLRGCDSLVVEFTTTNPNDSFIIDYGNGMSDTNVISTANYYFPVAGARDSAEFFTNYQVFNPLLAACTASQLDTLYVFRSPTSAFTVDTIRGCAPLTVSLTSTSPRAFNNFWDFDNDSIADDSVQIAQPVLDVGKQTIGLVIESIEGCRDTLYKNELVTVYNPPRVAFTKSRDTSCANDPVLFNDISVADTLIASRLWNFSSPAGSEQNIVPRPMVAFGDTGTYQISLQVTDSNFCTSSDTSFIVVINLDTPSTVNPLNLSFDVNSGNQISWNTSAIGDFNNYTLVVKTEKDSSAIDLNSTSYSDVNGNETELASYSLLVTDSCSNLSVASEHLSRLVIKGDNNLANVLRVNWTYLGDNNWNIFKIHRRDPNSTNWNIIDTVFNSNSLVYLDSTACESGYVYRVEGITNYGASSMSNEIALTSQFKKKTSALEMYTVSVIENQQVRLNFERNRHPGQRKYVIDRASADLVWDIDYDSSFSNFYIDSAANFKSEYYYYRVYMIDFCGNRNPVSNLGTSIALKGNGANGNVNLKWNKYEGWPTEYDFVLQVKFGANSFKELARFNNDGLSYIDYELHSELDTPWCYRVMAIKQNDNDSVFSNYYCDYLTDSIFIPNAFSPNNDGINDRFTIGGDILKRSDLGNLKSYNLKIIDRWGAILFETSDPKIDWDGTKAGVKVPMGQYWYILNLVDDSGEEQSETGPVFVIE